jgi:predicted nucleotidyltransferase
LNLRLALLNQRRYFSDMKFDSKHEKMLNNAKTKIVAAMPDVLAIYVFGSFGNKYERNDSDLDLAILPKNVTDSVVLWNLAQEIAIDINKDVDLIDLLEASTIFRYQIISTGFRFYCNDITQSDFIENCYTSMYLRFKEARALWKM